MGGFSLAGKAGGISHVQLGGRNFQRVVFLRQFILGFGSLLLGACWWCEWSISYVVMDFMLSSDLN